MANFCFTLTIFCTFLRLFLSRAPALSRSRSWCQIVEILVTEVVKVGLLVIDIVSFLSTLDGADHTRRHLRNLHCS